MPYFLHEFNSKFGATGVSFMDMGPAAQLGGMAYYELMFVILSWYLHCGAVQCIILLRVGLLIGVVLASNYAEYCTELDGKYCVVQFDSSLDVFYALTEGRQPWLEKMQAGGVAFCTFCCCTCCANIRICCGLHFDGACKQIAHM
jgi:hypothetical protein